MNSNEAFIVSILTVLVFLLICAVAVSVYLCLYRTNTPKTSSPRRYSRKPKTHSHSQIIINIPEKNLSYVSVNPMFYPQPAAKTET